MGASADTNWIVVPVHNNLSFTKAAVQSFLEQADDLGAPVRVLVVDNGSRDNTAPWLSSVSRSLPVSSIAIYPQKGVAHAWNTALGYIFSTRAQRVLVCNNDIVLRRDAYRALLADALLHGGKFVTGVGTGPEALSRPLETAQTLHNRRRPHPDFSCFLIDRDLYQTVGPFDERFKIAFGEDCDYHVRMVLAGFEAYAIDVPFHHIGEGSQTIKHMDPLERELLGLQADRNREYFYQKWGFRIGTPGYDEFFASLPKRSS